MKAQNKMRAKGYLVLKIWKGTELLETIKGENLIVDLGLDIMAAAIGGTADQNIVEYGAGTSGTSPASGDTSLTAPFVKVLDTVTFPSTGLVTFTFSMDNSEGNGATYQEWGLYCDAGPLFSRKTSTAIAKSSAIRIEGEWTISFHL